VDGVLTGSGGGGSTGGAALAGGGEEELMCPKNPLKIYPCVLSQCSMLLIDYYFLKMC
jgi:hypothetical protein